MNFAQKVYKVTRFCCCCCFVFPHRDKKHILKRILRTLRNVHRLMAFKLGGLQGIISMMLIDGNSFLHNSFILRSVFSTNVLSTWFSYHCIHIYKLGPSSLEELNNLPPFSQSTCVRDGTQTQVFHLLTYIGINSQIS